MRYSQFYRLGEEFINKYENNQAVIYNAQTASYEKATPIDQQFYTKNKKISFFDQWEPRIAVSVQTQEDQSLKFSYNKMAQYIHIISNTNAATPLDIWEPKRTLHKTTNCTPKACNGLFSKFRFNQYSLENRIVFFEKPEKTDWII